MGLMIGLTVGNVMGAPLMHEVHGNINEALVEKAMRMEIGFNKE